MSKVPFPGSERPEPAGARRVGVPAADQRLTVSIVLRPRSPQNEPPSGPADQGTVNQSRFAATPGADPRAIAAVEQFAHEENLTVEATFSKQRMVKLSGSVAQLEEAFQVELVVFEDRGKQYVSHAGAVYLPTQLVPVVLGVFGLSNPPIRPHSSPGPNQVVNDLTRTLAVYGVLGGLDGLDGSLQTVGIISLGGGGYRVEDLEAFFGGPDNVPTIVDESTDGVTENSPGGPYDGEITQDICIIGSIAPSATIVVYWGSNDNSGYINAVGYAVHDSVNNPSVLSTSWGWAEESWGPMGMISMNSYFVEAVQHVISVFAASGDRGWSDGLLDNFWHVDYPASDENVTGCGGTTLTIAGDGSRQAEVVWNDPSSPDPNTWGVSGGGVSNYFFLPDFQQGIGVPANPNPPPPSGPDWIGPLGRGVPDVASHADGFNGIPGSAAPIFDGTSAAAPLWAGLITLINQLNGVPTGYFNDVLYGRLAPQGALYDVTSGDDAFYAAQVGWDACTGWGSPNGAQIAYLIGPPTVSGVQPREGPVGGGTTIAILGAQFLGALPPVVAFDGAQAKVQFVSDNAITVILPPAATGGVVDVVVTTVQGSSGTTDSSKFEYFLPIPTVDNISPSNGVAGNQVIVSGSGFTGVTEVDFGGMPSLIVDPDPNTPDSVLKALVPSGAGPVHVTVTAGITSAPTDADVFFYSGTTPDVVIFNQFGDALENVSFVVDAGGEQSSGQTDSQGSATIAISAAGTLTLDEASLLDALGDLLDRAVLVDDPGDAVIHVAQSGVPISLSPGGALEIDVVARVDIAVEMTTDLEGTIRVEGPGVSVVQDGQLARVALQVNDGSTATVFLDPPPLEVTTVNLPALPGWLPPNGYIVQAGDTADSLSQRFLGAPGLFDELSDHDPVVGEVLTLPDAAVPGWVDLAIEPPPPLPVSQTWFTVSPNDVIFALYGVGGSDDALQQLLDAAASPPPADADPTAVLAYRAETITAFLALPSDQIVAEPGISEITDEGDGFYGFAG
jgi:kumamolisin